MIPNIDSSIEILSENTVLTEMTKDITKTRLLLRIDPGHSLLLLLKRKWDMTLVSDRSRNKFLTKHGIPAINVVHRQTSECSICCLDEDLIGVSCNHMACEECWKAYLTEKIKERKLFIECMDVECEQHICHDIIKLVLRDSPMVPVYQKLILCNYVEHKTDLSICTGPNCDNIHRCVSGGPQPIQCPCGAKYCSSCNAKPHTPATCEQMQLWERRRIAIERENADDRKSYLWLLKNTKECPRCFTVIEKNGGCSRMTCTNRWCYYQFCWECKEPWRSHVNFLCQSRDTPIAEHTNFITNPALPYYYRFQEYQQNIDSGENLYQEVIRRRELGNDPFSHDAFRVLAECHRVLKYSVVFEFYSKRKRYSDTFAIHQNKLKNATENLFDELRNAIHMTWALQRKITNKSQIAEQCLKTFLECCETGISNADLDGRIEPLTMPNMYCALFIFVALILLLIAGFLCLLVSLWQSLVIVQ